VISEERIPRRVASPWFKISAAYFLIHAFVIFVLDEVTAFAPDENNYLRIFKGVSSSNFEFDGTAVWSPRDEVFLKLTYFPAQVFSKLGFSDLQSIRILSSLATYLSLFILYSLAGKTRVLVMSQKNWIALGFFLPSIILWSSLGLRESFIFLWLTCIFFSLRKYLASRGVIYALALLASSSALSLTKTYLYAILLISLVLAIFLLVFATRTFNVSHLIIVIMVLAPIAFLPEMRSLLVSGSKSFVGQYMFQQPATAASTFEIDLRVDQGETLPNILKQDGKKPFLSWFVKKSWFVNKISSLPKISLSPVKKICIGQELESQADPPVSTPAWKKRVCSFLFGGTKLTPASFANPIDLFLGIVGFLMKPLSFIENGSPLLNLASYENIFWFPMYGLLATIVYLLVWGRSKWNLSSITILMFIVGFLVQSAIMETNVGTALRHRSVLLIGILILCAVFSDPRESKREKQC